MSILQDYYCVRSPAVHDKKRSSNSESAAVTERLLSLRYQEDDEEQLAHTSPNTLHYVVAPMNVMHRTGLRAH